MKLGRAIKRTRLLLGLPQGELAKSARLSQTYLSQIENDQKLPSLDMLEDICESLGVPMFFLMLEAVESKDIADDKLEVFNKFYPTVANLFEGLFLNKTK